MPFVDTIRQTSLQSLCISFVAIIFKINIEKNKNSKNKCMRIVQDSRISALTHSCLLFRSNILLGNRTCIAVYLCMCKVKSGGSERVKVYEVPVLTTYPTDV